MAPRYTAATTPAQSTTGTLKRATLNDKIRHNYPGIPIMALVAGGEVKVGEAMRKRGLIGKRSVEAAKHEAFTWTPNLVEFTVSARSSATEFSVSDAAGLTPKMTLVNASNGMTVSRITSINTSSGAAVVVSVGDTAFDIAVGDKLIVMGPAYGENSSSPYILMKDPDNLYNLTQIMRFTCAISRSAKDNPHYGGNRWDQYKEENVSEGLRKAENTLLFSERPSGTNESTSDGTLADAFRTTRGMWNWAQNNFPAGGSMTQDDYMFALPEVMSDTVGSDMRLVELCGTKVFGQHQKWVNNNFQVQPDKDLAKFGIEAMDFWTSRGVIKVVKHDAFDRAGMTDKSIIFPPEMYDYVTLRDYDFKPKTGIQANDVDGTQDEILGEIALTPRDGGESTTTITNWN